MDNILALFGIGAGVSLAVLIIVVWTIFWKGWALWIAARRGEVWWFLAILIINTAGILEIIYLFFVKKMVFDFSTRKFKDRAVKTETVKTEQTTTETTAEKIIE